MQPKVQPTVVIRFPHLRHGTAPPLSPRHIEAAILNRLGIMFPSDAVAALHVGNRPGDFQNALIGPRRQLELCICLSEQILRIGVRTAILLDLPRVHLRIAQDTAVLKAGVLTSSGRIYARADHARRFSGRAVAQLGIADFRHLNLNIDPIQQRAGNLCAVSLHLCRRTATMLCA